MSNDFDSNVSAPQIKGLAEFLDRISLQRRYSPNTLDSYERSVRHWAAWLADNEFFGGDICEVPRTLARNYVAGFSGKYSRRSIHNRVSALRSFYKFLEREGLSKASPFDGVKLPKLEKDLPVYLNVGQMPALLAAPQNKLEEKKIDPREALCDSLCLELLYGAGFRVSELCNLKWSNIDFANASARIIGKGAKERFCPFGEAAAALLKEWKNRFCQNAAKEDYVFSTKGGAQLYPRKVQRRLKEYLSNANLPANITPHKLRHSYATHLMNAGMDLRVLQELLGHASLSSTQIYTHLNTKELKDIYKRAHPRA